MMTTYSLISFQFSVPICLRLKMDILFKMFQERQLMLLASSTTTTTPVPVSSDISDLCGHSWKNDTLVTSLRFWVAGVSLAVTDTLGLLGNIISLITLSTMTKRGLFIKLLVALTVFDILFLVNGKIKELLPDEKAMNQNKLVLLKSFWVNSKFFIRLKYNALQKHETTLLHTTIRNTCVLKIFKKNSYRIW